jgi:hypothetical protein
MSIDYKHEDYKKNIDKWKRIDNVCSGEDVEQYLRTLNPADKTVANQNRNTQYKAMAIFYQIAGYTARGLNGLLFSKWPKFTVPTQLNYLASNVDGSGVSIYQQAQDTSEDVIKKGRAGLFVSYPETNGASSVADMQAMRVFATIHEIEAEQIINWRYTQDGAQVKLSLLTFMEKIEEPSGYENVCIDQIRELALESGVFIVRKWRYDEDTGKWLKFGDDQIPTDGAGKTWNEIPFTFVGSENNNASVDDAPMAAIAEINIGHYRNSADYEDNVWYLGQAQAWMSGLTQNHIDLMKANNMYVGSRELIGVPQDGAFGFESAPANTMVRQAMLDKVDLMIGLGARFIQRTGPAITAQQAQGDQSVQHSVLSLISSNISEAYTQCLKWAARYMNVTGDVEFRTTMDFVSPTATAQEIQAIVAGFVQGAIPASAYFAWMQKHSLVDASKTLEEFQSEINPAAPINLDENA